MTQLDEHGQPVISAFNRQRNAAKALEAMLGLCDGMVADRAFTPQEVIYLDTWLRDQQHLRNDPDVIDILDLTGDILADGRITKDELQDLTSLIRTVLEYRDDEEWRWGERTALNRLIGIVHGIVSDQNLNDREIKYLRRWQRINRYLCEKWPANVIAARVRDVLADGVITDAERNDLLSTLNQLVGGAIAQTGAPSGLATRLPVEPIESLEFHGKKFCLTGQFIYGTRRRCEAVIAERGGLPQSGVTVKLDYLVIGTISSRDWANTVYGTKIEKAIQYRNDGRPIRIISEEDWVRFL